MIEQPIDTLMTRLGLGNADLVRASTEQLTFKNVQKARAGRPITTNIQDKILSALLKLKPQLKIARRDLFRYDIGEPVVEAIHKAQTLVGSGKINYPQYVDLLLESGITRYTVEVAMHRITYFGTGGAAHMEQGAPMNTYTPGYYDLDALKIAIKDAQKSVIDYQTFLQRIHDAGITAYDANLRSREIRYKGESQSYKEDIPQVGAVTEVIAPAVTSKPKAPKKKPNKSQGKKPNRLSKVKRRFKDRRPSQIPRSGPKKRSLA